MSRSGSSSARRSPHPPRIITLGDFLARRFSRERRAAMAPVVDADAASSAQEEACVPLSSCMACSGDEMVCRAERSHPTCARATRHDRALHRGHAGAVASVLQQEWHASGGPLLALAAKCHRRHGCRRCGHVPDIPELRKRVTRRPQPHVCGWPAPDARLAAQVLCFGAI